MVDSNSIAVSATNLSRDYGNVKALNAVTLNIRTNSICGLLGSNGAGKTTLMSVIAGHDRPNGGQINTLNENPFESEKVAADTTFIRDNQRYPDDYLLRHVLATARLFHPRWDEQLAHRLVDSFKLPQKTQVRKYSRGQLSALSIIVGLASRAPITIFDEPYLGLDIAARRRFYELLIEDYAANPRTIIISTHLVEEMEAMFDQVIVLDKGSVVIDAAPEELAQSAFEITGQSSLVSGLLTGLNVLSLRTVGSLSSAIVMERLTDELEQTIQNAGAHTAPAPIHDLVAAIGNSYDSQGTES